MAEETRGGHDIQMQRDMWVSFCRLVKWSIMVIAVLLILMALFLT